MMSSQGKTQRLFRENGRYLEADLIAVDRRHRMGTTLHLLFVYNVYQAFQAP